MGRGSEAEMSFGVLKEGCPGQKDSQHIFNLIAYLSGIDLNIVQCTAAADLMV